MPNKENYYQPNQGWTTKDLLEMSQAIDMEPWAPHIDNDVKNHIRNELKPLQARDRLRAKLQAKRAAKPPPT